MIYQLKHFAYYPYKWVRTLFLFFRLCFQCAEFRLIGRQMVLFISTPTHGNLGDQAIVLAQKKIFEDIGLRKNVIEICKSDYFLAASFLSMLLANDALIVIDGGGNVGTLWIEEEYKMRDIIKRFPQNPIVIFPQTAYFEDTDFGKAELQKAAEVYQAHENLTVFCRDQSTFNLFREKMPKVNTFFVPDTVLYLHPKTLSQKSGTILFCLRDDKEKCSTLSDLRQSIENILAEKAFSCRDTSTVIQRKVTARNREEILREKWEEFASANLIITDRLHGMIFSAIVGTPCIALDNVSRKVSGGQYWLKHLPYIRVLQDTDFIEETLRIMLSSPKEYIYDFEPLEASFTVIKDRIRLCMSKEDHN